MRRRDRYATATTRRTLRAEVERRAVLEARLRQVLPAVPEGPVLVLGGALLGRGRTVGAGAVALLGPVPLSLGGVARGRARGAAVVALLGPVALSLGGVARGRATGAATVAAAALGAIAPGGVVRSRAAGAIALALEGAQALAPAGANRSRAAGSAAVALGAAAALALGVVARGRAAGSASVAAGAVADLTLNKAPDAGSQYASVPLKVWADVEINGIVRTVFAAISNGHAPLGEGSWLYDSAGNRWPIVAKINHEDVAAFTDVSGGAYPGVDAAVVLCDCHDTGLVPPVVPVHAALGPITGARAITGVGEWGTGNVQYFNQAGTATEFGYTATAGSSPSSGQLVVEGDPANPTSVVGTTGYYYATETRRGPSAQYILSVLEGWSLAELTTHFNSEGGDPWYYSGSLGELRLTPGDRWADGISNLDDGLNGTLFRGPSSTAPEADIVVTNTGGEARLLTGLTLTRREAYPFPEQLTIGAAVHDLTGLTALSFPTPYELGPGAALTLTFVNTSGGGLFWSELALVSAAAGAAALDLAVGGVARGRAAGAPAVELEAAGGTQVWVSGLGGILRNNDNRYLGFRFEPLVDMTVIGLSRFVIAGSSQLHSVKLLTDAGVLLAEATIDATTGSDEMVTAAITPVLLVAGTAYRIGSREYSGGDFWYNQEARVWDPNIFVTQAIYGNTVWPNLQSGSVNWSYVPVGFEYTT